MDFLQRLQHVFDKLDTGKRVRLSIYGASQRALSFTRAAYESGAVLPEDVRDWAETSRGKALLRGPACIKTASYAEAVKVITHLVRNERFSGGALDKAIESGLLKALLDRYCDLKSYEVVFAHCYGFSPTHLAVLKASKRAPWQGANAHVWANSEINGVFFGQDVSLTSLPNKRLDRRALFYYVADEGNSTLECAITILSWGSMEPANAKYAFESWPQWKPICQDIRNGIIDRRAAYYAFDRLRDTGVLQGMGPGFFTKLIYFLAPDHDGYIMDQWTARSMNLLLRHCLVDLNRLIKTSSGNRQYRVSDENTDSVYEVFCSEVERLAEVLDLSPGTTEEMMFSSGRGTGDWRNYVIENAPEWR